MTLTLLGLGAAGPECLTLGALQTLRAHVGFRFVRSRRHPVARWLESSEGGVTFDAALDDLADADAVAQRVLTAARVGDVLLVLPGHPLFGDPSGVRLWQAARAEQISVRLLAAAPAASPPADFESLVAMMARLRAPVGGCPWDQEQTPQTLRRFLVEEVYEVLEALDSDSPAKVREELGDLLLQVVFHAQIASESGKFDIGGVTESIVEKLVRRHPHVFGDVEVSDSGEVLTNWGKIKRAEPGYEDRTSVLDGVPKDLPALARAQEISRRAVKVGFEWPSLPDVLDKVDEELAELRAEITAGETQKAAEELGDLLFTLVNVARRLDVDAEDALRQMTRRFAARFHHIEDHARATGRVVSDLPLSEMEQIWQTAKRGAQV